MTLKRTELTVERLRELLDYNPETGVFKCRCRRGRLEAGDVAGAVNDRGYRIICCDGEFHRAHRLAWFLSHGRWPDGDIDHINGIRDDNRLANLREATRRQNNGNMRCPRHNTSGVKGVWWHKRGKKWAAGITLPGRRNKHLGLFHSKEEAAAAYLKAAEEHFGVFARKG